MSQGDLGSRDVSTVLRTCIFESAPPEKKNAAIIIHVENHEKGVSISL